MTLSDLASIGSLVSGGAVLASLGFLYFQMRQMAEQMQQSRRNQQAAIRQGQASALMEVNWRLTDPDYVGAIADVVEGRPANTINQIHLLTAWTRAVFQMLSENFEQHKEGLLTARDLEATVRGAADALRFPGVRVAWQWDKSIYREDFAAFIDAILADTPIQRSERDAALAQWNSYAASELAKATGHNKGAAQ